ncbi:MAG: DEAD/DEAH box helicase family protein [Lachnospiraceae bacterium]|nr:DEAD/DEAH box helicase family protein [Lachnospiraceae bacterium]
MSEIKDYLVKKTIEEMQESLKQYRKCILIRPTGFGKTYIAIHEAANYKCTIFLYPRKIIKQTIMEKYKKVIKLYNIRFISYQRLAKNANNLFVVEGLRSVNDGDSTLFIFDEAHMTGAEKTSEAICKLQKLFPNSNYLGLTATPERADWYDYKKHFFDDRVISTYTLTDCIRDELFNKPHYIYTLFSTKDCITSLKEKNNQVKDRKTHEVISKKLTDIEVRTSAFLNMDEVLKNSINEAVQNITYLKFMVFFSKIETLHAKIDVIENAFLKAFPTHTVRTLIITSEEKYKKNVDKMGDYAYTTNTIDLIASVDMLSLGYHVDDLSGVVMLRATESDIIYKQQIGRCLSIASQNTAIIFDFVGNMFRRQYHVGPNSIIERDDAKGFLGEDIMNLTSNDVLLHDYVTELEDIDRIIEISSDEIKRAVINAYLYKNAPIKFCARRLHISILEFKRLVNSYRKWET